MFSVVVYFLVVLVVSSNAQTLTQEERDAFLNTHNNARSTVNPSAANMVRLQWSESIEIDAQAYADQCNFRHSSSSNGENLYLTSLLQFSGQSLSQVVDSWVNEVSAYTYQAGSAGSCSGVCGHYTQVVWANSMLLGCGYASCNSVANSAITSGTIVVCQYSPPGNFIGQSPYISGSSCSQCPADQQTCVNNLCDSTTSPTTQSTDSTSQSATSSTSMNGTTQDTGSGTPSSDALSVGCSRVVLALLLCLTIASLLYM